MAIKKVKPHMTLGIITFILDVCTIVLGTALVFKDVDGLIYGVLVTYLMAIVLDRIMYGIDEGKMTLIVTEHGEKVSEQIDEYSGRGLRSSTESEAIPNGKRMWLCVPATISRCIPSRKWSVRLTRRRLRLLWIPMRW